MNNKKGQMKISFGLIFSIILIILFLTFAFFGMKKFFFTQDKLKAGKLMHDLQEDIDKMWKSSQGSQEVSYETPKDIEVFCLEPQDPGSSNENAYFIPGGYSGGFIQHVDWEKTIRNIASGRLCFEPEYGEIKMILEKNFGETDVTIVRVLPE
jgi:hypothetical protein